MMPVVSSNASQTDQRKQLQEQLTAILDIALGVLAVITLCLLLAELALQLPDPWSGIIVDAQLAIWVAFVAGFIVELLLAPSKKEYLKSNWLVALSLALPALRVFRLARAIRLLRTTRAVRALGLARVGAAFNRVSGVMRGFLQKSRFAYLFALTVLVVITGAFAGQFFEREASGSSIDSIGNALWWSVTLVTTVNSQAEAVTFEGRLIGLLLRLFGVGVFGYLTAHLAAYLLGSDQERSQQSHDIAALTRSIDELRHAIEELSANSGRGNSDERGQGQ